MGRAFVHRARRSNRQQSRRPLRPGTELAGQTARGPARRGATGQGLQPSSRRAMMRRLDAPEPGQLAPPAGALGSAAIDTPRAAHGHPDQQPRACGHRAQDQSCPSCAQAERPASQGAKVQHRWGQATRESAAINAPRVTPGHGTSRHARPHRHPPSAPDLGAI